MSSRSHQLRTCQTPTEETHRHIDASLTVVKLLEKPKYARRFSETTCTVEQNRFRLVDKRDEGFLIARAGVDVEIPSTSGFSQGTVDVHSFHIVR